MIYIERCWIVIIMILNFIMFCDNLKLSCDIYWRNWKWSSILNSAKASSHTKFHVCFLTQHQNENPNQIYKTYQIYNLINITIKKEETLPFHYLGFCTLNICPSVHRFWSLLKDIYLVPIFIDSWFFKFLSIFWYRAS